MARRAVVKWALFAAIVVAPGMLSVATLKIQFGRARSVRFCASCHVMAPYVDDMRNPKSGTLAAKHYKNRWIIGEQCYACHTNYDFLGPLDAKVRGLRHAAAYYLRPERARPRLYKPYPDGACLHCHEDAKSYLESISHEVFAEEMRSGEKTCVDCHTPSHAKRKKIDE